MASREPKHCSCYAHLINYIFLCAFFWVIPRRLNFICQHFGTVWKILHTYPPMKMEQTECSETSEYKIQTPGNYPEESIQHSEHGESSKSRIFYVIKLCWTINLHNLLITEKPTGMPHLKIPDNDEFRGRIIPHGGMWIISVDRIRIRINVASGIPERIIQDGGNKNTSLWWRKAKQNQP